MAVPKPARDEGEFFSEEYRQDDGERWDSQAAIERAIRSVFRKMSTPELREQERWTLHLLTPQNFTSPRRATDSDDLAYLRICQDELRARKMKYGEPR